MTRKQVVAILRAMKRRRDDFGFWWVHDQHWNMTGWEGETADWPVRAAELVPHFKIAVDADFELNIAAAAAGFDRIFDDA